MRSTALRSQTPLHILVSRMLVACAWMSVGYWNMERPLAQAQTLPSNIVLLWGSSGGGWRSMISDMGYANAFDQALHGDWTQLYAVSGNSGGAWFSAQFFFSQSFFSGGAGTSPDEVATFTENWMNAFLQFQEDLNPAPVCSVLGLATGSVDLQVYCEVFANSNFGGSWADFVNLMMNYVASAAYNEPRPFGSVTTSAKNRVPALRQTDFMIQTTISDTSRTAQPPPVIDTVGYLGPKNSDQVIAVPIGVQYVLTKESEGSQVKYIYNLQDDSNFPLMVVSGPTSQAIFQLSDWEDYYLWPDRDNGQVLTTLTVPPHRTVRKRQLRPFFGGRVPTVAQITGASSAVLSQYSGLCPSFLAQAFSNTGNPDLATILYPISFAQELAVCSQWPNRCDATQDTRFHDGGYSDGPSVALNLGNYQQKRLAKTGSKGFLQSETVKLIVTNNNYYADSNAKFLSYFDTDFNNGIDPGDYIWAPGTTSTADSYQAAPWRSMQIFEEYQDDDSFLAAFQPVSDAPSTNITTALYTATTIDNPSYGVLGGQHVEILLLQINSNIPTFLLGLDTTARYTPGIVTLVHEIAGSTILQNRLQSFLYG